MFIRVFILVEEKKICHWDIKSVFKNMDCILLMKTLWTIPKCAVTEKLIIIPLQKLKRMIDGQHDQVFFNFLN